MRKRTLIYDVAAETTGAASILEMYYNRFVADEKTETYIVTSVLDYNELEHVHIIRLPWVKKSWLHRIYCDLIYVRRLIKEYHINSVINLQNVAIPFVHVPQTVYLHNAIPLTDYKFSIKNEYILWFYKNVIGKLIMHNLKYANCIIVQAEWIKELLIKYGFLPSIINVERVESTFVTDSETRIDTEQAIFFYPASSMSYKNHSVVLKACSMLKEKGIRDYRVVFTLNPNVDKNAMKIKELSTQLGLPTDFVGTLNHDQMSKMYRQTILLFPSLLETVGLPLIEAKQFNSRIIVADLPYAKEAIGKYNRVTWFSPDDPSELYMILRQVIEKRCD